MSRLAALEAARRETVLSLNAATEALRYADSTLRAAKEAVARATSADDAMCAAIRAEYEASKGP